MPPLLAFCGGLGGLVHRGRSDDVFKRFLNSALYLVMKGLAHGLSNFFGFEWRRGLGVDDFVENLLKNGLDRDLPRNFLGHFFSGNDECRG